MVIFFDSYQDKYPAAAIRWHFHFPGCFLVFTVIFGGFWGLLAGDAVWIGPKRCGRYVVRQTQEREARTGGGGAWIGWLRRAATAFVGGTGRDAEASEVVRGGLMPCCMTQAFDPPPGLTAGFCGHSMAGLQQRFLDDFNG